MRRTRLCSRCLSSAQCQMSWNTGRWAGKVAVVTGASSGIGAAVAQELARQGLRVVGVARRVHRVQDLAASLQGDGELFPLEADLSKENEIIQMFKTVQEKYGGVDILVNSAGVFIDSFLTEGSTADWRKMLEINVLALSICTREAVQLMRQNCLTQGHIIHINSIAGHNVPAYPETSMYFATKHGVKALTEGLRKEFLLKKERHKITSISPGLVKTEILNNSNMNSEEIFNTAPHLNPDDITQAVVYALSTPPHVQVHEIIIKPVGEE